MATLFANRRERAPCFDTDAVARWLDQTGLPLMLAVLATMALVMVLGGVPTIGGRGASAECVPDQGPGLRSAA
jgi:hypothetical protein